MGDLGKRRKNSNNDDDHKKSKVVVKEDKVEKKRDEPTRSEYMTRRKSRDLSMDETIIKEKKHKKSEKHEKKSSRHKKKESSEEEEDSASEEVEYADEKEESVEELTPEEQKKKDGDFKKFPIHKNTVEALKNNGIQFLFPIQVYTFKDLYEGMDLIGRDRTGSGKT